MSLEIKINNAIKLAMKNKDQQSLTPLRAIKTALLMQKTQKGSDQSISNEDEMKILQKLVKQRRESAEIYRNQGRDDLADPEIKEAELIQNFLPKALSEKEIESKVNIALEEIRPFLNSDGGDISLVSIDDDKYVKVQLHGACAGCSVNQMTLNTGVEMTIKKHVPQIETVTSIGPE